MATWFSIAPVQPAYVAQGFDAEKWSFRLRELAGREQVIEQHSHFYGKQKGPYDVSAPGVEQRLTEDRQWLADQGFDIRGFVAGGWAIDRTVLGLLARLGFTYDCSVRPAVASADGLTQARPGRIDIAGIDLVELPTTSGLTLWQTMRPAGAFPVLYLHDYDLLSWKVRATVKILIRLHGSSSFVSTREIAKELIEAGGSDHGPV
jgi:hypothetical protein